MLTDVLQRTIVFHHMENESRAESRASYGVLLVPRYPIRHKLLVGNSLRLHHIAQDGVSVSTT